MQREKGWYWVVSFRDWACDYWDGVNWKGAVEARMHGKEPNKVGPRIYPPNEAPE